MDQLHRRFTVEQVKVLLHGYCQGALARADAQDLLGVGKTRFFALLQEYRADPDASSIVYERETHARISAKAERAIATELRREQQLVEDPRTHFRIQLLGDSRPAGTERHSGFGNDDYRARQTTGMLQNHTANAKRIVLPKSK